LRQGTVAEVVARVIAEAAEQAGIGFHVYPHMLRHSAGYMLANEGIDALLIQAHLGHRDIRNTTRYTALSAKRLAGVRVRILDASASRMASGFCQRND
jgi:site-specific recombinase XerD